MIEGVIKILITDTTIQSKIGKNKSDNKYKVYPVVCPQKEEHPYIVIRVNSKSPEYCKDGSKDFTYTFAVFAYAITYQLVNEISDAIEEALTGKEGTFEGVKFSEIRFVTLTDGAVDVSGEILYLRTLIFETLVNEDTAT